VEAKIDIKTLSEILGHSSVTITMNRYVHPSLELKRETMEQLADFISVK
jgi:integrase